MYSIQKRFTSVIVNTCADDLKASRDQTAYFCLHKDGANYNKPIQTSLD